MKRGHPYAPPEITKGEGYFDLAEARGPAGLKNLFNAVADQTILLYTKMEILAHLGNVPVGYINVRDCHAKPYISLEIAEQEATIGDALSSCPKTMLSLYSDSYSLRSLRSFDL